MAIDAGHVLLAHLSFLADHEEWRALAELLCEPIEFRPCRLSPVDTPIEALLERIDGRLASSADLRNLFHIALLSAHLLFPGECPTAVASFLAEKGIPGTWLPGVDTAGLSAGRWSSGAVTVALGQEALTRYFVAGLDSTSGGSVWLPLWAEPLLDDSAKKAVFDAAQAAARVSSFRHAAGFCCFPLCIPNRTVQIRGRSLGLPLGLVFARILAGGVPARNLAATGDLALDGSVRRVGGIEAKAACLAVNPRRFRALIFPAENEGPLFCEGLDLLPAASLEEAIMLAGLYSPGKTDILLQLPPMLRNPERFVAGCRTLDPAWIRWAGARGKLDGVAQQIAASPDLFKSLLFRLKEALASRELELSLAIAGIVDAEHYRTAAEIAPRTAFDWCTQNIALANHIGDIAGAAVWIGNGGALQKQIAAVDPEAVADHFNHCLVSDHNRYRFVAELPSGLKAPISFLENQLEGKKLAGSRVDITLGRLYGTLGQHFAFCGPRHLETAIDYFARARSALGQGTVADLKVEWIRQLYYEAFAYLDAGRLDEARQRICNYLEISEFSDVRPAALGIDLPWSHNLLARFLADTLEAGLCRKYLSWAEEINFAPPRPEHPWQLWAYNVGRIAASLGDVEAAAASFKASLELSSNSKPTIRVMALLGLSGLARIKALPDKLSEMESAVREAAAELNPGHFADLFKTPFARLLDRLWHEPGRLFPFTYH
jgi:hypothetical protein